MIKNIQWFKDDAGEYWNGEYWVNGKRQSCVGTYYDFIDEAATQREPRQEQEAWIADYAHLWPMASDGVTL